MNEVFSNIIKYAYDDNKEHKIEIEIFFDQHEVVRQHVLEDTMRPQKHTVHFKENYTRYAKNLGNLVFSTGQFINQGSSKRLHHLPHYENNLIKHEKPLYPPCMNLNYVNK